MNHIIYCPNCGQRLFDIQMAAGWVGVQVQDAGTDARARAAAGELRARDATGELRARDGETIEIKCQRCRKIQHIHLIRLEKQNRVAT